MSTYNNKDNIEILAITPASTKINKEISDYNNIVYPILSDPSKKIIKHINKYSYLIDENMVNGYAILDDKGTLLSVKMTDDISEYLLLEKYLD